MDDVATGLARLGAALGVATATGAGGHGDRRSRRAAGLEAARRALRAAGAEDLAVTGHHADGRPRWPVGWTGSIAHTGEHAVAGVAAVRDRAAVGIDLEARRGLSFDDAELVLGREECSVAARSVDPADTATLLWSAKEAAFKAWSTAAGGLAGVDPVDIRIVLGDGAFTATAVGSLAARGLALEPLIGRFDLAEELVTTLAVGEPAIARTAVGSGKDQS